MLANWLKDEEPFCIYVHHRGRYFDKADKYNQLCAPKKVERDRAQAPTKTVAEEWAEIARARLSHMLDGSQLQWYPLGAHLAGLDNDAAREHCLRNLDPAEYVLTTHRRSQFPHH